VRVWQASDLSLVRVLRGHRGSVLTLLAVGNVLLSGARDNTIRCACGEGVFEHWGQHRIVSSWHVSKQASQCAKRFAC
jgi:hypothetical protein